MLLFPLYYIFRINISWDLSRVFLLPQHQSGRRRDFFLGLCRLWFCPLDISRSTFDQDFFRFFLFGIQNFYPILKYHHFILLMMALGVYFCSSQSVPMKTLTRKSKILVGWAFFSFVYWKIWENRAEESWKMSWCVSNGIKYWYLKSFWTLLSTNIPLNWRWLVHKFNLGTCLH